MAVTQNTYTGDGSTVLYSFTFPYLTQTDVKVKLDGATQATTAYSFANATTVQMGSAPGSGVKVIIYRDTDNDNKKATFYPGSAIKAEDLNDNYDQILYVAQEVDNNSMSSLGDTPMQGDMEFAQGMGLVFEGATTDNFETRLAVADPTADRTVTLPNVTGTVITTGDTGTVTSAMITDATIVNNDINTSAAIAQSKLNIANATTSAAGYQSAADKTKLDGIETAATADQTNAEIRTAVEAATDSNVFTDDDHTKLNNIETAATADQTNAEIRAAVEAASDSNVFTDADHTKLNGIETAATADQTAAEIKTAYESNAETNPLTDAEKLVIDGVTANTSELNKLDGVTASTAELNIVAGKSFKTSSGTLDTTSDTEIPSSKVIAAHVASSQSAVGGFVSISDEVSFPNLQPANGVVVSINNAAGVVVNGSGVSTTGRRLDTTVVTINGFPSSLYSETLAAGVGLLVTATSTANTYNYHKILVAESDVKQLSDDINDFNSRYRIASSAPSSNNDEGDLYFDTGANKMKVYNGSAWDDVASVGSFFVNTISSSSGTGGGSATFNGSAYRFTLSNAGQAAQQHIVSVNGVIQKPNSGTSQPSEGFAIDGSDIIFSAAPASGADYFIITQGSSVSIGTPSANSVNSSHIIDGSITNADISNSAAIAQSKLAITIPGGGTNIGFNDNVYARFGNDNDLEIHHLTGVPGHTYVTHNGTANFTIDKTGASGNIDIKFGSDSAASFIKDGAVELFHDGTKRIETTSGGANIVGDLTVNGAALSSAPTFTATADGAIAANKPCVLRSDGKVSQAAFESSTASAGFDLGQSSFAYGSATETVGTTSVEYPYQSDYDTENKKILAVYNTDSGTNRFFAVVGTVSGSKSTTKVTWGTPLALDTAYCHKAVAIYNPAEKKFLVGGQFSTYSKMKYWHITLDSGGGMTASDPLAFEQNGSTYWSTGNSSELVAFHNKEKTQYVHFINGGHPYSWYNIALYFWVMDMSGAVPARLSTFTNLNYQPSPSYNYTMAAYSMYGLAAAWDPVSNKVLMHYHGRQRSGYTTNRYSEVYKTFSFNDVDSNGDPSLQFNNVDEEPIYDSTSSESPRRNGFSLVYMPTHGAFLSRYQDNSGSSSTGTSRARMITLDSSGNITLGTELSYNHDDEDGSNYSWNARSRPAVYKDANNVEKAYQIGCQSDSQANSFIQTFTVSGTGSSASVAVAFTDLQWGSGGASTTWSYPEHESSMTVGDSIVFTTHAADGNNNSVNTFQSGVLWFAGRNSTDDTFVGFSDAAYSDTATATINVVGNTTTQSGLSPASNYYVSSTGTLTTSASGNPYAGKALTATSLLIKG